ncbi:hypothetical protein [Vibrio owensii]|uniref:hypothetical protein n=1 Tax=Vibrio owensii TaxID=696485 RepID=UPI00391F4FC6
MYSLLSHQHSCNAIWQRLSRRSPDILIESSFNATFTDMRLEPCKWLAHAV